MSWTSKARGGGGGSSGGAQQLPIPANPGAGAIDQHAAAQASIQNLTPREAALGKPLLQFDVPDVIKAIFGQGGGAAGPTGQVVGSATPWAGQTVGGAQRASPFGEWGTTTGGQSAYALYRAGEMGSPLPAENAGMQGQELYAPEAPTSGYASGSPESTQGGPIPTSGVGFEEGDGESKRRGGGGGGGAGLLGIPSAVSQPMPAIPQHEIVMGRYMMTPAQNHILGQMGMNGEDAQRFLAEQIMSGNPAYGPYTAHQIQAAQRMFGRG